MIEKSMIYGVNASVDNPTGATYFGYFTNPIFYSRISKVFTSRSIGGFISLYIGDKLIFQRVQLDHFVENLTKTGKIGIAGDGQDIDFLIPPNTEIRFLLTGQSSMEFAVMHYELVDEVTT